MSIHQLYDQPSHGLARKTQAGVVGGAVAALVAPNLIDTVAELLRAFGVDVPVEVTNSAYDLALALNNFIIVFGGFLASYLTRERVPYYTPDV